jgi:hypothetical protein
MSGNTINNVADPLAAQDAATKNYVDNTVGAISLAGDVTGTPGANSIAANLASGNHIVAAINDASSDINNGAINATFSTVTGSSITGTNLTGTNLAISGSADFGGVNLTSVATPVLNLDGANKLYVDNQISGLSLTGDVTGSLGSNSIGTSAGNNIVAALNNAATTTDVNNTAINVTANTLNAANATNGLSVGTGANQTTISSAATTAQSVSLPNYSGTIPVILASTGTLSGTTPVSVTITGVTSTDHICVTRIAASGTLGNITATAGAGSVSIVSDNAADVSTVDIIVFKQ